MLLVENSVQTTLEKLNSNGVALTLGELVRYKGLASRLNLKPASAIKSGMAGALTSKFKGRGMEFDEARHYQPGDDIRSIDWRVTARTGKTHTKLYREERERPVLLYIDLHASMHFGTQLLYKSVQAMHAGALVTFSALSRGDKIGCVAACEGADIEIKPKSTSKHVLGMLNQIVQMQNQHVKHDTTTNIDKASSNLSAMTKLSMLAKPGTLVYVISDFANFNTACFDVLGKMKRHCEIRPLHIVDPLEQALPNLHGSNQVLLSDGTNEQALTLGDKKLSEQYSNTRAMWFTGVNQHMTQMGMQLRTLSAAKSIEDQLVATRAGLLIGAAV